MLQQYNLVDESLYEVNVKAQIKELQTDPKTALNISNWGTLWNRFINNFILDIHLLDAIRGWNMEILKEVLELVAKLIELFQSLVEIFTSIGISTPKQDAAFRNPLFKLMGVWTSYTQKLKSILPTPEGMTPHDFIDDMCSSETGLISGATVRELIMGNEIYLREHSFKSFALGRMQGCDTLIAMWWSEIKSKERKDLNKDEPQWSPRALAFVFDTDTGMIHTGSSKCRPVPDGRSAGLPILPEIAERVSRARLPEGFREIVDKCNASCTEQAIRVKRERKTIVEKDKKLWAQGEVVEELYRKLLHEHQSEERSQLPARVENAFIFSWAFHGEDITSYSACTRCRMFYKSWILMESPTDIRAKQDEIEKQLQQQRYIDFAVSHYLLHNVNATFHAGPFSEE